MDGCPYTFVRARCSLRAFGHSIPSLDRPGHEDPSTRRYPQSGWKIRFLKKGARKRLITLCCLHCARREAHVRSLRSRSHNAQSHCHNDQRTRVARESHTQPGKYLPASRRVSDVASPISNIYRRYRVHSADLSFALRPFNPRDVHVSLLLPLRYATTMCSQVPAL